ncbi:phage protease [Breoghania sp.]|uniref:phage protease n=1 Tax=Breoghania sp. TaxID=2065378 RepID=UPI0029C9C630|nr:phage protease [Breoghania sp.]
MKTTAYPLSELVSLSGNGPDCQAVHGAVLLSVLPSAEASDPEWIKVTPRGPATCRDGRQFLFDPERLVSAFKRDGIDIPVDLDHAIAIRGPVGEVVEAVGWVDEVEARDDGTYAHVAWLDAGRSVLKARTHRFISPTFHADKAGIATWLHSIALVAAPALALPAVASAKGSTAPQPQEHRMKSLATALGLAEGADEAACLSALTNLKASTVTKAVHDEALSRLAAANDELTSLKAAVRSKEIDAVIEGALTAKKIVPAQREQYAALCATDEGLAHVRKLLDATPAALAASGLDEKGEPGTGEIDPVTLAAAARAYQHDQRSKGVEVSIIDAVNHVKEKRS